MLKRIRGGSDVSLSLSLDIPPCSQKNNSIAPESVCARTICLLSLPLSPPIHPLLCPLETSPQPLLCFHRLRRGWSGRSADPRRDCKIEKRWSWGTRRAGSRPRRGPTPPPTTKSESRAFLPPGRLGVMSRGDPREDLVFSLLRDSTGSLPPPFPASSLYPSRFCPRG